MLYPTPTVIFVIILSDPNNSKPRLSLHDSMMARFMRWPGSAVRPSVRLSPTGIVSKRLNTSVSSQCQHRDYSLLSAKISMKFKIKRYAVTVHASWGDMVRRYGAV